MTSSSRYVQLVGRVGSIRTATFQGIEHVVLPVIALVEGVIQASNSLIPELVLSSELSYAPEGWNNRPVLVDHPVLNGSPVSANIPSILETSAIGYIFNARMDGDKLKMDAYLNPQRATDVGESALNVLTRISEGETVEVSVGAFVMSEKKTGSYNGSDYGAIWRTIVPDHLALLSVGKTGACSVEMGCGTPRAASLNEKEESTEILKTENTKVRPVLEDAESTCSCGSKQLEEVVLMKDEKVTALIEDEGTKWKEEDRQWLVQIPDVHSDLFASPAAPELSEIPEAAPEEVIPAAITEPMETSTIDTVAVFSTNTQPTGITLENYLADAPPEIREALETGIRVNREERENLVSSLKATQRCSFSDNQLSEKSVDELKTLVTLAGVNVAPRYDHQPVGPRPVEITDSVDAPPSLSESIRTSRSA